MARSRLTLALNLVGLTTLVSTTAFADPVSDRANCAHLRLEAALGNSSAASAAAKCSAPAPSASPMTREVVAASAAAKGELPEASSRPEWVDRGKRSSGSMLYGVGVAQPHEAPGGQERVVALQRAAAEIGAQLEVQLDATMSDRQTLSTASTTVDGRTASAERSTQQLSSTTQLLVSKSLEGMRVVDSYRDPSTKALHLLASLDLAEIAKREDAVVDSVIGGLAEAEERAAASVEKGLEPAAMNQLFDAIARAQAVGRTQVGRRIKDRWAGQLSRSTSLAKELVRCVELKGALAPWKPSVPVTMTCRDKPIRRATFNVLPSGGFIENARPFTTDDQGNGKVLVGRVFGAAPLDVVIAHDLSNTKAGPIGILGDNPEGARTNVAPSEPADAVLRLNDVETSDQDAMKLVEHIEAWATRRHGLSVGDKGPLFLRVQFNYPGSVKVGAKVSQPVEIRVAIELNGRMLAEKIGKSGGLADSQIQAKKQALVRALDVIRSW